MANFVVLLAGICTFFRMYHSSVDLIYPRYDGDVPNLGIFDFDTRNITENYDKSSFIMDRQGWFTNSFIYSAILIPIIALVVHACTLCVASSSGNDPKGG